MWHHKIGEVTGQLRPQHTPVQIAAADNIGRQPFLPAWAGFHHPPGITHIIETIQEPLNFLRLDAVPINFHLFVVAPEIIETTVSLLHDPVAGAVPAPDNAITTPDLHKTFRRQLRPIQIFQRETVAKGQEFTGHTVSHRRQMLIEHFA